MQGDHQQPRTRRLLACASAALVVTAVFADAAQAGGLDAITGQQDPVSATVATATSTVDNVTTTVTGTVETTTSATPPAGEAVSSTVSTATGAVSGTTQTVSSAVQATADTVSGTTQTVSTAVDQTLAATEGTVGAVASGRAPTIGEVTQRVVSQSPPSTSAASSMPQAPPATVASAAPGATGDASTEPTKDTLGTTFIRVEPEFVSATSPSPTAPKTPQSASESSATGRTTTSGLPTRHADVVEQVVSVRQHAPQRPLPGSPRSLTTLFGGSSTSVSLALAALLGTLLLAAFGPPGARLRPSATVFRPPDVLFPLERPG